VFKLEKVFQNDDHIFINLYILINSLFVFFSIYTFSILENNSFFYFFNYKIFKDSSFYEFSFLVTFIFFISQFFFPFKKRYNNSYLYFFKTTFIYFLISYILSFFIILYFIQDFFFTIKFFYIFILCLIFLIFNKFLFNQIYKYLIHANIIQRNILLVGNQSFILNVLNFKANQINIFKCCLTNIEDETELKKFKQEIRIPVFTFNEDARIILEYHAIGQIWILDSGDQDQLNKYLNKILDFPIDILQINISKKLPYNENLINNVYEYKEYSISRFYGVKFFIKILLDKVLSLIFLIIALPIIIIFSILIYLEDGFPIFFKQERTGWDGRRFVVYKMRSLKNIKFDKTLQVQQNDSRLLKVGRFIRKFSIDELPQFFNVLKGDMSIVGPRPHPIQMDMHFNKIYNYMKRYKTLPGITGWAQVNGSRGATPTEESIKKRMEYDLWYLNNWSMFLDLWIIVKTFYAVIKFKG
jgi:putative colanic acid biosynthesis UDP-glucose lipid carrier transferase